MQGETSQISLLGATAAVPWSCPLLPTPSASPTRYPAQLFPARRIDGNTALLRDIYPSVSLQIQKNFAKSKWRVSEGLDWVRGVVRSGMDGELVGSGEYSV